METCSPAGPDQTPSDLLLFDLSFCRWNGSFDVLRYRFGNRNDVAESVAVLCPLTSRRLSNDEEVLEAAAFKVEGPGDALRLAWNATFRDWRADPTVERAKVRSVDIDSDEPVPALLDGETFELDRHVHIELAPEAFQALRPAVDA